MSSRIITTKNNKVYNTISFLAPEYNLDIIGKIKQALTSNIAIPKPPKIIANYHYFNTETKIIFSKNHKWQLTKVEIKTMDKKSLLSNITYTFYKFNFKLTNAIITTFGNRVENSFFISNKGNFLSKNEEKQLTKTLLNMLT